MRHWDVASVPGSTGPARRPSDRLAVVKHVHDTEDLQETDWLEWKSGYDLTKPASRAAAAKHILGFADRMPDVAARNAEGYAYLLLGVEPGTYHGMPVHDSADIENWLRPYVGDKVIYEIDYVTAPDGQKILFITVDPPQWGDDIHSLRKAGEDADSGKTIAAGTIFVRKSGKTERASDADVDRLTERARRQGTTLALSVDVAGPVPALPSNCFDEDFRDAYLEARRRKLLAELPGRADPMRGILKPVGETRSPEQFIGEVDQFVDGAGQNWRRSPSSRRSRKVSRRWSSDWSTRPMTTSRPFRSRSRCHFHMSSSSQVWPRRESARTHQRSRRGGVGRYRG